MSTYALRTANPKPTDEQITEGLSGNICRCGEYAKIYTAVRNASAEMAGGTVTHNAPTSIWSAPAAQRAAAPAAAVAGTSKEFEFATALSTIEEFEPLAAPLRQKAGVLDIQGSQLTV